MNKLFCPNCYSTSVVHHHTDWNHIDNSTGLQKAVSVILCLDCKTLFVDDQEADRELCEIVGKNNATANREWLKKRIKDLDRQIEELSRTVEGSHPSMVVCHKK